MSLLVLHLAFKRGRMLKRLNWASRNKNIAYYYSRVQRSWKTWRRWEDNIKTYLKEIRIGRCRMD